jgi:hypothetical protein
MKKVARKDLVVGVEYTLDGSGVNKAHYVGRDEVENTLFFMTGNKVPYLETSEGFLVFDTEGDAFFLES